LKPLLWLRADPLIFSQTVYHRLATFKELTAQLAAEHSHRRLNPLAVELGLAIPAPVVDDGDNPAERYYEHALDLAEKLFDGDIDQQTYEEQLRYMGGVKAYPLYTVDKLISTIIKHVSRWLATFPRSAEADPFHFKPQIHTVNSDSRCQDLVTLLEKDRARDFITTRQQIAYRMEAEAIGAEDPLYRIEWVHSVQRHQPRRLR
jgi:paired amphipathic helix protein Sin3a